MPHTAVEHEARELRTAIRALVRRFSISERADVSCCGMTVAQAATLQALAAAGPLRLGDLGRRLGISPSTLTRNLQRLEERGLLERLADPDDARASLARLTRAGRRAAAEVDGREIKFAETVLQQLPAHRRDSAVAGLRELLQAIRRATEGCCPGAFDHLMEDGTDDPGPEEQR
jgi:DNA-binding MarR family transcriptional regulator